MSFFGDLLSSPFNAIGEATGLHINPFQPQDTSWSMPNLNLGNLMTLASILSPGGQFAGLKGLGLGNLGTSSLLGATGLSGLADPGKMNTGDWLKLGTTLLGGMGSGNVPQAGGGQGDSMKMLQQLSQVLYPSALQEAGFYTAMNPYRLGSLQNAYNASDPANYGNYAETAWRKLSGQATAQGTQQANMLARRGYGSGVQDSARLGASNQANRQAGQVVQNLWDPVNRSDAYMKQASTLSPGNVFGAYNTAQGSLANSLGVANQQRSADAAYNASKPPSFLESLLGIGGQVLPYIVKDNPGMFKF